MKNITTENFVLYAPAFKIAEEEIDSVLHIVPNMYYAQKVIKKVVDHIFFKIEDAQVKKFLNLPSGRGPLYRSLLHTVIKKSFVDALSGNHNCHPEVVNPKFIAEAGFFFEDGKSSIVDLMKKIKEAVPQLEIDYHGLGDPPEFAMFGTFFDFKKSF